MEFRQSYYSPVVANEVNELYNVRRVEFFGERRPILLDNGDGLLVSICNVLLLRGTVTIDRLNTLIKSDLLSLVQESLIMLIPNFQEADEVLNLLQSLTSKHDLIRPCFTGIKDFQPVVELGLFRALDINLYHGCLNPQLQDCAIASEVCLPKQLSFGNNTELDGLKSKRKGDLEEEESMLKALQLSEKETYQQIGTEALSGENQVPVADGKEEQEREVYDKEEKKPEVYKEEDQRLAAYEVYKEEDQRPEAYEEEDQEAEAYEEEDHKAEEDQELEAYEEEDHEPEVYEEEEQETVVYLKEDQGPEEKSQLDQNYLKSYSPLTEKGLLSLMDDVDGVKENELCIFLCNNHFSTLYKHNGELYLLENASFSFPAIWRKLYQIEETIPLFKSGDFLGVESAYSISPEVHDYVDGWGAN